MRGTFVYTTILPMATRDALHTHLSSNIAMGLDTLLWETPTTNHILFSTSLLGLTGSKDSKYCEAIGLHLNFAIRSKVQYFNILEGVGI